MAKRKHGGRRSSFTPSLSLYSSSNDELSPMLSAVYIHIYMYFFLRKGQVIAQTYMHKCAQQYWDWYILSWSYSLYHIIGAAVSHSQP